MSALPSRIIATIPRPATGEEVRISVLQSGAARYVDLRVFAATRSSKGEPRPTKTGLCIRADQVDALIAALRAAR